MLALLNKNVFLSKFLIISCILIKKASKKLNNRTLPSPKLNFVEVSLKTLIPKQFLKIDLNVNNRKIEIIILFLPDI